MGTNSLSESNTNNYKCTITLVPNHGTSSRITLLIYLVFIYAMTILYPMYLVP